jgi:hypothetical protein
MSQSTFGLHRLSTDELKRLLRALHRGALASPITRSSLIEKAFGHIEGHLDLIVGRDEAAAKAIVLAVLGERGAERADIDTGRAASELVYMAPPSPGTRSRDLVERVRELLASATTSALVLGLSLDDDRGLVRTAAALIAGRDAHVRLVFDTYGVDNGPARVRAFVRERLSKVDEKLSLFACSGARLRARAVVIDAQRALITSGELGGSEEDGTIDVGVSLRDSAYVKALEDEWSKLLAAGIAQPVDPS